MFKKLVVDCDVHALPHNRIVIIAYRRDVKGLKCPFDVFLCKDGREYESVLQEIHSFKRRNFWTNYQVFKEV